MTTYGFHKDLAPFIYENQIIFEVKNPPGSDREHMFAAQVKLYLKGDHFRSDEISVPSGGSFSPDSESYWRIKHAAIILDNWDEIVTLCRNASKNLYNNFK